VASLASSTLRLMVTTVFISTPSSCVARGQDVDPGPASPRTSSRGPSSVT
jgi:hypothetical protein